MEQKNLDTLLNNLQRNIEIKNYVEAYRCYREILDIDSTNIQALYAILEVGAEAESSLLKPNYIGITSYEIISAIKTIFASNDNDLKIKAFYAFVRYEEKDWFEYTWKLDEKNNYYETVNNLQNEVVKLTADISLLIGSQSYDSSKLLFDKSYIANRFAKIATNDLEFFKKIHPKTFKLMATKKLCKEFNYKYYFYKNYINNKNAVVFGDKCLFKINKHYAQIYILGSKLEFDIYNDNLCIGSQKVNSVNSIDIDFFANKKKNKNEFDELVKRIKESGGIIKEHVGYYDITIY